jgi:hypothetical protein
MKKQEIKSGLSHCYVSPKKNSSKITKEEVEKQIQKRRERDEELVTGQFQNKEMPGARHVPVRFVYKMYKNQSPEVYELFDGETYNLKRGVVRHINNNCYVKEYVDLSGAPHMQRAILPEGRGIMRSKEDMQMIRKIHRFAFTPLDYMEDDLDTYPSANLIEVTASP